VIVSSTAGEKRSSACGDCPPEQPPIRPETWPQDQMRTPEGGHHLAAEIRPRQPVVLRKSGGQIQHDPAFDPALVQARENVVDVLELVGGDGRLHLALCHEVQ
jgi:hypothetical protein